MNARVMTGVAAFSFAVLALFVGGCASVSVHDVTATPDPVAGPPKRILVTRFAAPPSNFHLGLRADSDFTRVRRGTVDLLAKTTVREVKLHAADSELADSVAAGREGDWVITGRIAQADQGSRLLRMGIGLGVGETRFRTEVTVLAVTANAVVPVMHFETTGGSGKLPGTALGVATGATVVELATGGAIGAFPGLSSDVERTAYEISALLSVYLAERGWLGEDRRKANPKMKGRGGGINARRIVPGPVRNVVTGGD